MNKVSYGNFGKTCTSNTQCTPTSALLSCKRSFIAPNLGRICDCSSSTFYYNETAQKCGNFILIFKFLIYNI